MHNYSIHQIFHYFFFMYFSDTYKTMWWSPPRIASRALLTIPWTLNFTNGKSGHDCTIANKDYDVIYPIRNPYSRAVSWWNLRHNDRENLVRGTHISFKSFIEQPNNEYFRILPGTDWEPISMVENNDLRVRKIIRYEHLIDDLLEIDFIQENFDLLKNELFILKYQSRDSYRKDYIPQALEPVCNYYTQDLADIVWEHKKFEFVHGGYEKDSWKYLL